MTAPHAAPYHEPRLIGGRWILLALLLTIVACAAFWIVTHDRVRDSLAIGEARLDYARRADWPTPPVRHTTMEKPISNYIPSGPQAKWQTVDLGLLPLERRLIAESAQLAGSEDFVSSDTRDRLTAIVERYPRLWYPRWLLAQWHTRRGESEMAADLFQQAFALAPAALMIPYADPADRPMIDLPVGTITLGCDQSDGRHLDQSLQLVYPHLTTDARGRVYLPVYHTILRRVEMPDPPGHHARLAADYQWFSFPGRVAQLRPTCVWSQHAPAAPNRP